MVSDILKSDGVDSKPGVAHVRVHSVTRSLFKFAILVHPSLHGHQDWGS